MKGASHGVVVRAGAPCAEAPFLNAAAPGLSPVSDDHCRMSPPHSQFYPLLNKGRYGPKIIKKKKLHMKLT